MRDGPNDCGCSLFKEARADENGDAMEIRGFAPNLRGLAAQFDAVAQGQDEPALLTVSRGLAAEYALVLKQAADVLEAATTNGPSEPAEPALWANKEAGKSAPSNRFSRRALDPDPAVPMCEAGASAANAPSLGRGT
jgi:hypothetical protein